MGLGVPVLRFLVAVLVAGAVLVASVTGVFISFDRLLENARYALASRPASGDVVIADIDSSSLKQIGIFPWPREVHARLLDQLMALDARDVAFDVDFSSRSTDKDDEAFAAALARAGGFTFLASFEQLDGASGTVERAVPRPEFMAEAGAVYVNVAAGSDGLVDRALWRPVSEGPDIPSLAAALSGKSPDRDINIDFSIAASGIDRISVKDVLAGTVDPRRIADKQVIVGASAIELRDQFAVPRYGYISGPVIQALATETLLADRNLVKLGPWPALATALLAALIFTVLASRVSLLGIAATALGIMVASEVAALVLFRTFAVEIDTACLHVGILLLFGQHLLRALLSEYSARQKAQARLAYLATHDEVTGLKSRRGLLEWHDFGGRPRTMVAVRILRLDLVRGALGQSIHDRCLKQLAMRFATIGGGECAAIDRDLFVLSVDGHMPDDQLERLGQRIRATLEPALAIDGHIVHAAVATGSAAGMESPERLIDKARLAADEATGRRLDAAVMFTPALETQIDYRRRLDAALRRALHDGALNVVFQPQVRLSDVGIVGVEALVRWSDPVLGQVSPADFIPLAEETGLIVPLGAFVMREACRLAAQWDWGGKLAVNVSPAQVLLGGVVELVEAALAESGLSASRLDIEITESLLVERTGTVEATLSALRRAGVGIAIDDFGTGYSALSYLSGISFDKLKIDQSFVRDLAPGSAQEVIVGSIIDLAHKLGKSIIAEGVETPQQRELLAEMGCEIGQGYHFSRPVPADEIARMLQLRPVSSLA